MDNRHLKGTKREKPQHFEQPLAKKRIHLSTQDRGSDSEGVDTLYSSHVPQDSSDSLQVPQDSSDSSQVPHDSSDSSQVPQDSSDDEYSEAMSDVTADVTSAPEDPTDDMFADNVLRMKFPIQNKDIDQDEKEKEESKVTDFFSNVVKLRNSGGGVIIIENQNYGGLDKSNDPLYKDRFYQMVEGELQLMAMQQGEMGDFESWYQAKWWNGQGKWLIYYIKDGRQLTFPQKSKVFTATGHNIKEVRTDEIKRRLLITKPEKYEPSVKHVHCDETYGELRLGKECVHLHEDTNVQLKAYTKTGEKLISTICKDIREYFSAFSQNENGGSIYFGILERKNKSSNRNKESPSVTKTPVVCGILCDIDVEKRIREKIKFEICNMMLWIRHNGEQAKPDEIRRYYDVRFHNIEPDTSTTRKVVDTSTTKKVVEVSVAKFHGCVFSSDPKPPYLDAEGEKKEYTTEEWIPIMMKGYQSENWSKDNLSLTEKFQQLKIRGPEQVYEVPGSAEEIQQTIFKTKKGLRFTPEALLDNLNKQYGDSMKGFTDTLQKVFAGDEGVAILENFASILREKSKCVNCCPGLISDFLVLTERQMPIFISLVNVHDEQMSPVQKYNREMARLIKINLSKHCQPFVTILFGVVNCSRSIQQQIDGIIASRARHTNLLVQMNQAKLYMLLRCLTIMASVFPSPLHNRIGTKLLNIATQQQFGLIWDGFYRSPCLLIKGFPGSGKTVIAQQLVRKLVSKGAAADQILFLTQHASSCCQVRKMKCCVALTPAGLERAIKDATRRRAYEEVIKYIIVDDAQLICANKGKRDNKWFEFLWKDIWEKKIRRRDCIIWVFYGEHTYRQTGSTNMKFILQQFKPEEKVDLKDIIRNSHNIARFASKYSEDGNYKAAVEKITTVHKFEGQEVVHKDVSLANEEQYEQAIGNFLYDILSEGYNLEDVAILFSREGDIPALLNVIISKTGHLYDDDDPKKEPIPTTKTVNLPVVGDVGICSASDNDVTGHVVIDTVRRYSGLDRPVVLAVNPFVAKGNRYTRIKDLYLMIATRPIAKLEVWKKSE